MSSEEITYAISPSRDSTLAIEICKTGLMRKKKHLLFFERYSGQLSYFPDHPEMSCVQVTVEVDSLVCRDPWLKPKKREIVARYARSESLTAGRYPEIQFRSTRVSRKALRGFLIEGELKIREVSRPVSLNVVLNTGKKNGLQIDGDAVFRLSEFGIAQPTSHFGLIGTQDEVLIHTLLWATPPGRDSIVW
jgi:polyisoprenoid-binding protein YceI